MFRTLNLKDGLYRPEASMPGGAKIAGIFTNPLIKEYPETTFTAHPGQEISHELGADLRAMISIARRSFPRHLIDVWVHREAFQSGVPESLPTHVFGIHSDGFKDGFYVMSTDEPTILHADMSGTNPVQAKPGELIYVPGDCLHAAPNPTHDGERVRIKLIPHLPYGAPAAPISQFVNLA